MQPMGLPRSIPFVQKYYKQIIVAAISLWAFYLRIDFLAHFKIDGDALWQAVEGVIGKDQTAHKAAILNKAQDLAAKELLEGMFVLEDQWKHGGAGFFTIQQGTPNKIGINNPETKSVFLPEGVFVFEVKNATQAKIEITKL